ncbi:hypothetical protein HZB01_02060 [Candidatus Woesearchaeota archaeon]|nr:hypothetical protein [Candidatus Woesearchaeota archaeon]
MVSYKTAYATINEIVGEGITERGAVDARLKTAGFPHADYEGLDKLTHSYGLHHPSGFLWRQMQKAGHAAHWVGRAASAVGGAIAGADYRMLRIVGENVDVGEQIPGYRDLYHFLEGTLKLQVSATDIMETMEGLVRGVPEIAQDAGIGLLAGILLYDMGRVALGRGANHLLKRRAIRNYLHQHGINP